MQRFLFRMFKDLIRASYFVYVVGGTFIFQRIPMVIADQPEERALLCFKGKDSFIDCSLCTLPCRNRTYEFNTQISTPHTSSDENEIEETPRRGRRRLRNNALQLSEQLHPCLDVQSTIQRKIRIASHNQRTEMSATEAAALCRTLISESAHELPPAISAFAGLGSSPFNLYNVVSFEKLHVMDLVITRLFRDLVNTFIQHSIMWLLSKLMTIINDRFSYISPSVHLPAHRPFRTTTAESQVGISGKIRRLSAPFLWYCLMGVSYQIPDSGHLLFCVLKLDIVNSFLCVSVHRTEDSIIEWQNYLFSFGKYMASLFGVDITTKLHRIMRHVRDHIIMLGCINRGSAEDNEIMHKVFKNGYSDKNKHIENIAPQLLQLALHPWVQVQQPHQHESYNENNKSFPCLLVTQALFWDTNVREATNTVRSMSGRFPSSAIHINRQNRTIRPLGIVI